MDESLIEYHFDSIQTFHLELDDLLNTKCQTESEIKNVLSRYIRFLKRYKDDYVSSTQELCQAVYRLIDSLLYLDHSTFILSLVVSDYALASTKDVDDLIIIYAILYFTGKEDARWMNYIAAAATRNNQNRLLHKLLSELESFTGGYQLMSLSLKLLFEMGKVARASLTDLDTVSLESISFFFQLVESTTDDSAESFNYEIIQFILVLNEQYMLTQATQNKVLNVISNRFGQCDTFIQNLLFMLNRAEDTCIQILILKLLYGIFTRPDICDIFYTNDLCVLVDIIIRALQNLSSDSNKLRNSYLRVLKPLLINTSLKNTLYKKHEIHKLLCSLIAPVPSNTIKYSTRKIIKSILEEWWQGLCNKPVAPLLGVHVNHVVVGTQDGQNGIAMSATPSNVSSDSELDNNNNSSPRNSNEEKGNLFLCI